MQIQQTMINLVETNPNIVDSIIVLCLTGLLYYGKKILFEKVIKKIVDKTPTKFDDDLYPFVNRILSIAIWVIGICLILINLGFNINYLFTILGANAIIIAYACKDTFSNIVAGLVLMADRPFRVGDIIQLPSKESVEVLTIGLRRSRFLDDLTDDKSVIIIPNSDLAKSKIKNYTYAKELNEK